MGAGTIAQLVKCLQKKLKNWIQPPMPLISVLRQASWGLLASQPSQICKIPVQWEALSPKQQWKSRVWLRKPLDTWRQWDLGGGGTLDKSKMREFSERKMHPLSREYGVLLWQWRGVTWFQVGSALLYKFYSIFDTKSLCVALAVLEFSSYRPGWPWTHRDLVSALVLVWLKVCTLVPSSYTFYNTICLSWVWPFGVRVYLLCKCYSSEGKGFLAVGRQGLSQSHTAQQTSHKSFIEKTQEGGCLCSGEKQQRTEWRQAYIGSFGGRVFPGWDSQAGDWWDFELRALGKLRD